VVATNTVGQDTTQVRLNVQSTKSILNDSQVQHMEKLQYLEDSSIHKKRRFEEEEIISSQAPVFTTSLKDLSIKEYQRAHFEARLIPVGDSSMRVIWAKDGAPIKTG